MPHDESHHGLPLLDAQRALHVSAYIALIDARLTQAGGEMPFRAAQGLLIELDRSGLAAMAVIPNGGPEDRMRMTLFNITATATGTANALLRNWQIAARNRLQQGVRK